MADLRVTELDFAQIKENLINYLKSQTEFSDYNFAGSGLNTLLDILAYNTHYNAVLAHLQTNEMFIDTAIKRSSIVSIAKTLGYTPRSVAGAKAKVSVNVEPSVSYTGTSLTIPQYTKFSTKVNDRTYTFMTLDSHTASKISNEFYFNNVEIIEGAYILQQTSINADNVSGPIKIKNNNIDLATLNVTVQNSISDLTTTAFDRTTTIIDIKPTSTVYWVEEGADGYYHLIFGDDIIGKKLTVGNIVNITYVASKGAEANGAQTFTCSINLAGAPPVTTLISASSGGSNRETPESIRFNAPKFNATRNRAVTVEDYKTLIFSSFDKAKSVAVWGGEDNIPPIYGKVFVSIDPKDGYLVTQSDKDFLINTVLKPRSVLSILHEFVDPVYLHVGMNVKINYNPRITPFTGAQIEDIVAQTIQEYFENELSTLDKRFYYSRLINKIQTSHSAILGSLIDMRLQRRIVPILNTHENLKFYFTTPIEPNSLKSTYFTTSIGNKTFQAYIQDFPNETPPSRAGTGTLKLINRDDNSVIVPNYGTVYYGSSALVNITDFYVTSVSGADIRFNALPQELGKDLNPTIVRTTAISTEAVYPFPAQNIIITLDNSETNAGIGTTVGLKVTAVPSEI
jgi:hypothetical protein